ncbi:MAG: capsular polysaccharide biosynthesis protein [Microgenomates group bacterium Gr01-1014_5]|nr:MAG: capsular polysaccharide biosynthesis protein [Microgenomates group bacterium Gr01-1014_5]
MLIGLNIFNAGQFFYHLLAARILGKAYYGDLAAILSIIGEIGIIHLAIGMTIIRFIASEKKENTVNNYIKWFSWWSILVGGVIGILALVASPLIIKFLNITQPAAIYLLGPALFVSLIVSVGRSILQGLLKFDKYVLSMMAELGVRILLTVVLAALGYAVFGAMSAIVIGTLFSIFVIKFFVGTRLKGIKGARPKIQPLLKYAVPVFVQGLALTSMYTVDVLMVKHFFSPEKAGLYAAMGILGRTVFYGAAPITSVMFPLISKRYARGEGYYNIFFLSAILIGLASALIVGFFWLFSNFAILALYGSDFLEGASFLWLISLFMALVSFASLFVQFYLSIGKTEIVWPVAIASGLQAILIWFIHPDLLTVIKLSILSSALLVAALLVYFPFHARSSSKQ